MLPAAALLPLASLSDLRDAPGGLQLLLIGGVLLLLIVGEARAAADRRRPRDADPRPAGMIGLLRPAVSRELRPRPHERPR